MLNNQNIVTLKLQKQSIETVLAMHEQRAGACLPEPYETEFWAYHQKKAVNGFLNFYKLGGIVYLFFSIFIIFRNYFIIPSIYLQHDFWRSVVSIMNGGICLLILVSAARHPKAHTYFRYLALLVVGWAIFLTAVLTLSQYTSSLRQQFVFIIFIFIFGYIMIGVKPLNMFIVGLLASAAIFAMFFYLHISFDSVVLFRVFFGSNLIGFAITKVINHQERGSFLKTKLIEVDQEILKNYNNQLLKLSQYDGLTGIANRRSLDDALERYYALAQAEHSPLAVLFIDIDYFKAYNDHYGHLQGDQVLKCIAQVIQHTIRHQDFVARYGGEEFVVLLPNSDIDQAHLMASSIARAADELSIHHEKSEINPYITISVGLAVYTVEYPVSANQLLSFADQALYRAKACGRHQICRHVILDEDHDIESKQKAT